MHIMVAGQTVAEENGEEDQMKWKDADRQDASGRPIGGALSQGVECGTTIFLCSQVFACLQLSPSLQSHQHVGREPRE